MMAFNLWWAWLAAAIVFGIIEILAPSYLFLGFALGALAVSMLLLNTGLAVSAPLLLLGFAALSLAAWLILRYLFQSPQGQVKHFTKDIND
ncbi:MAG: NfeD family protein [Sedimentitalea sp.]